MPKPDRLVLSWGRTEPMRCPRCASVLWSATGIADHAIRPYAGAATLCDQCATWLIFEQRVFPVPALGLRVATADEIASIDPDMRALAERCAAEIMTTESKH